MILIYLLILFFVCLITLQFLLANPMREGLENPSDLDKLSNKVDGVKAEVFDLSLNVAALQKNVATLINQQSNYAASLKDTATDIPS